MVNLRKTLREAHRVLEEQGISHALIGGLALGSYGVHRATVDIDFLAAGSKKEEIKKALIGVGFQLRHESDEVLQFEGLGLLDILLANRPLSLSMLKAARNQPKLDVYVLRAEDLIGLKIQAYKNDSSREFQDKADIQSLLRQNPKLDMSLIKHYADLFDEWPVIEALEKSI